MNKYFIIGIIVLLTLISGFGDSQGFYHASFIWKDNKLVWTSLLKSFAGFAIGIGAYWIVIRYLHQFNIVTPEIQTIGWFSVTIIGLALLSGKLAYWNRIDQIVALFVLIGVCILIVRTS
jgi:hypothetical protein